MFWAHNKEMTDELMNKGAEINARDNTVYTSFPFPPCFSSSSSPQTPSSRKPRISIRDRTTSTHLTHCACSKQPRCTTLRSGARRTCCRRSLLEEATSTLPTRQATPRCTGLPQRRSGPLPICPTPHPQSKARTRPYLPMKVRCMT